MGCYSIFSQDVLLGKGINQEGWRTEDREENRNKRNKQVRERQRWRETERKVTDKRDTPN